MATESLIVELDAKTSKLDSKLKNTEKRLNSLDGKVEKSEKGFSKFTKAAAGAAAAVTAVSAVMTAAVSSANQYAIELEVASNRAGETVESMQSLAFAASSVGVSLEKLGDISKDTREKIGEFLATGGGGFKDFVDVLGLSGIEATNAALAFQEMSGPQVLQAMVTRMEVAGVSAEKMSFALEGMASDTTDLIPLLKDGGAGIKGLREEFDDLNATLSLEEIHKIRNVGDALKEARTAFDSEGKRLIAEYSEELIKAINAVVTLGVKSGQAFDLIATSVGNPLTIAQAAVNDFVNDLDTLDEVLAEREEKSFEALSALLGTTPEELGYEGGKKLAESMAEGFDEGIEALEVTVTKGTDLVKKEIDKQVKWEDLKNKEKLAIQSSYVKAAGILGNQFLEDNKAIQAGLIVADTATGVMRAFATSSNIYEAFANAAVVTATGIAQLANLQSASSGGGSISGGGSAGSSQTTSNNNFSEQETSTLELSSQSESGAQETVIRFETDSGDDLIDAIAGALNDRVRNGRN